MMGMTTVSNACLLHLISMTAEVTGRTWQGTLHLCMHNMTSKDQNCPCGAEGT